MRQKGFALILIVVTFAIAAVVGAYYFGLKKGNANLTALTPSPVITKALSTPTPTTKKTNDPTISWKTYSNGEFSFKYPEQWITEGIKIFKSDNSIEMWAIKSDGALYNECMKLDEDRVIGSLRVKTYSGVATSEMCDPVNLDLREKWIVKPQGEGYQPGLQYSYRSTGSDAEEIFSQILSTFKFTQ